MRVLSVMLAAAALSACSAPHGETGMTGIPIVEATIADLQTALAEGRTSCRAIVEAHLARIEAYDKASGLGAITEINPRALEEAAAMDARRAAGERLGVLHCMPILVKDNFDTYDMPTTGGSVALKGSIPPDDAFMVRRLREEDAIIIAKTNMAEWAFSPRQSISSSYGRTANAYDVTKTPAGSSGGTASGVAASFGVAGLGSDTGNSIRGPSSHLALFGIRSTIGLTSRDGVIPLAFDRDIAGPMTRTVEDGARLFNVIAGYDPADPYTELGRGRKEADYTVFLDANGLQDARLGVLSPLVDTGDANPEIIALFDAAVADLQAAGAEIIAPVVPDTFAAHTDTGYFCPRFRHDMADYLRLLGEGAPITDVNEALEGGLYGEDDPRVLGGLEFFAAGSMEADEACPDYAEHPGRQAFLANMVAAMDAAGVDALIYPSWTHPPADLDRANEDYRGDNSQVVAPATGQPAVSVPMGFTEAGLPTGLQILGRPYAEGTLFRLAYAYEQATRHRRPPPGFPALEQ